MEIRALLLQQYGDEQQQQECWPQQCYRVFSAHTIWSKKKAYASYKKKNPKPVSKLKKQKHKSSNAAFFKAVSAVSYNDLRMKTLMSPADLNSPQSFCIVFSEPTKGLANQSGLSSCNKKIVLAFQMLKWLAGKGEPEVWQELS